MEPQPVPVNIGNVSDGAMVEAFEVELKKVLANIADLDTKPNTVRKITLELKLIPKDDRMQIDTVFTCVSKLAPIAEHTSRMFLAKGTDGNLYAVQDDPRQHILFRPPTPKEPENLVSFAPASGK